ncbi:MAG: hypothetical protein ACSHXF_09410 [Aquaticitalea sp.]
MKKIITLVAVLLITVSATSQNKKAKANDNDCYLEMAAITFKLSDDSKAKLNDLLTARLEQSSAIKKKIKSSEISKEEGKKQAKTVNQTYYKNVADLTGKSKQEVMSFEKEAKSKCK